MMLAMLLLGIITAASAPLLGAWRDRSIVAAAASEIAGAHQRARIHAILVSRVAELDVRADSLVIRTPSTGTSAVWSIPGPLAAGVTLSSPARTLQFAPTGVTIGFANATFVLSKGSARRQVVVSRLGRVRILP